MRELLFTSDNDMGIEHGAVPGSRCIDISYLRASSVYGDDEDDDDNDDFITMVMATVVTIVMMTMMMMMIMIILLRW